MVALQSDRVSGLRRESDALEVTMKTQGEIEAAICQGMSRFELEYMGRGPKDIRTHLIDDLVLVRLQGVLTAAEQHLVKSLPADKGETCSRKFGPICWKPLGHSWSR